MASTILEVGNTARGTAGGGVRPDPDYVLQTLLKLVDIPSPTGNEEACGEFMAAEFGRLGMRADLQRFAPSRANAVGTLVGTGTGRDLLLTGHMDTSYSGSEPGLGAAGFQPHGIVEDGHVIGLGASNMKCGLAAALGAAQALATSGIRLGGDLIVAGVAGEIETSPVDEYQGQRYEGYGTGTRYMVAKGVTADAAIVGEATGFRVSMGHLGSIWLKITVHGDLLHTALSVRDDIVYAVYEAQELISRLRQWIPDYQRRTEYMGTKCGVAIGAIRSGNPYRAARTPQSCVLYVDVRYPPTMVAMDVKREIRDLLNDLATSRPSFRYDLESYVVAAPSLISEQEAIVQATQNAASAVLGKPTGTMFRAPMDDSTHLQDAGIPTINFGVPGPDTSPAGRVAGERVRIEDVVRLSQIYANLAMEFCGTA